MNRPNTACVAVRGEPVELPVGQSKPLDKRVARKQRSEFRGDVSITTTDLDCATLHRGYAISHRKPMPLFLNSIFQPTGE